MEADKTVKVDCLIWDDAWDLFKKKKVGDQPFLVYHDFPKLTRIIATQYGGLPLYFFFIMQIKCLISLKWMKYELLGFSLMKRL